MNSEQAIIQLRRKFYGPVFARRLGIMASTKHGWDEIREIEAWKLFKELCRARIALVIYRSRRELPYHAIPVHVTQEVWRYYESRNRTAK